MLSDPKREPQLHEHGPRWTAVDEYAKEHLVRPSDTPLYDALNHACALSHQNELPKIEVSALQGKFLAVQAALIGARHILEVGTLAGYSTIWLASSHPDVKITTIEILPEHKAVADKVIAYAGIGDRVKVILGAGNDVLPSISHEVSQNLRPKFDMVFIDADKPNNLSSLNHAIPMCRSGACIIVDNVVRRGKVADAEAARNDERIQGSREVIEGAGADPRLQTTLLQTVGEKNYDGFLLCLVK